MFKMEKSSHQVLAPDYHHPMGASQLKRIFKCSGSVEACKDIKDEPGEAAKFGSLVHEYAYEIYHEGTFKPSGDLKAWSIAHEYLTALHEIAGDDLSLGVMEHRLFMPDIECKYGPLTGTVDYAAVIPFERLLVVDLKTGMQDVQPKDNPQLMFYAAACFYNLDSFSRAVIPRIDLVIIQINDRVGVEVKTHTVTEKELADFVDDLRRLVDHVENDPELTPGEHCHELYCAARFTCPAYKKYVADNVGGEIVEIPKNELAEPIDFARWLSIIPAVEDKISQIKKLALQAALDTPELVPGWTVKQSFGHRKWENIEVATKQMELMLGIEAYKRELVSPAQAEKLIDKKLHKKAMPETVRPDLGYKLVKKGKDELDDVDKFLEG
jgi:hypothetical protein